MRIKNKKPVVVAVSGGFDPLHIGHIRMFEQAKKLGDTLVVILNNDNWLKAKKGYSFMPEEERKELIESLAVVDKVVLTKHPLNPSDMSVSETLRELKPNIFANGGDRTEKNIPEILTCNAIGCRMVFGIGKGGKLQSSSWLLAKYLEEQNAKSAAGFKPRPGQIDYSYARFAPVLNCIVRYKGKILLLHRSKDLHFYPDCWNGVSGFLDDRSTLEEKAFEELKEELGLSERQVIAMKRGEVFEVEEEHYKKTWIVHPLLIDVTTDKVVLDWESDGYRWFSLKEACSLKLVSGVESTKES